MRKLVCVILMLCLLAAIVPVSAAAEPVQEGNLPAYDPYAAAAYAEAHWDDGKGECAQFVSTCLGVGGIVVPSSWSYYSMSEPRYWGGRLGFYTNPYVCSGALLKWLSGYYEVIKEPDIYQMDIGDVILMSADGNPDGHAGIITGFGGDMPLYTAHNGDCHNAPVNNLARFLVKTAPRVPRLCHTGGNCAGNVFRDMPRSESWAHEPIDFVYQNGLFLGTEEDLFSPRQTMTRSMMVTVLWRMSGAESGYENPFTDVEPGSWYETQIAWAAEKGIVDGVGNGQFMPLEPVTREQVATILLRFASVFQEDRGYRTELTSFADNGEVSPWAVDAVQWAVSEGILTGSRDGSSLWLLPDNSAARVEVAAMLMRFMTARAE